MPVLTTCAYCGETFDGRTNQYYCSSDHRIKAFRAKEKEEKQKLATTQIPIYFDFLPPLTPAEKAHKQVCEELNILYNAMEVAQTMYQLEGVWEYADLKEMLLSLKVYQTVSERLLEGYAKINFSVSFFLYMQTRLKDIALFYKQVLRKSRQLIKKYKAAGKLGVVSVELEPTFVEKMKAVEEKCIIWWLGYKRRALDNDFI